MFNKTNHVGRPSNKELKQRKVKKILLFSVPAVLVCALIALVSTGGISKLMGNSVTEYYCDDGYTLNGNNCVKLIKEKAYYIGDVNKDGSVNILDTTSMEEYFSGTTKYDEYQLILADVNKDKKFNVADETILRRYISDMLGGSSATIHYIGNKTCPTGYNLKKDECVKEEIVPAKVKKVENTKEVLYGDVDLDGEVTDADSIYLNRYLAKWNDYTLNDEQLKNADVNNDGKVNNIDKVILARYLVGWYKELPYTGTVTEEEKELLYGDVDLDGEVTDADSIYLTRYLAKWNDYTLNDEQLKNADVNNDGKVNNIDKIILARYLVGWYKELPYTGTVTEEEKELLYGDVDLDGKVTIEDVTYVQKYFNSLDQLSEEARKNADVNLDSKIDEIDSKLIQMYIASSIKKLPHKICYGDVNLDGKINMKDLLKINQAIVGYNNVKLNDEAKLNADINLDGKVNEIDKYLLNLYVAGWYKELPYTKYKSGDANLDGNITIDDATYIQTNMNDFQKLSAESTINADVNLDGNIDNTDVKLVQMYVASSIKSLPYTKIKYGDVNLDGKINMKDLLKIKQAIVGYNNVKLNDEAKLNADINLDDKIDDIDTYLLQHYVAGWNIKLPYTKVKFGDVNLDGKINLRDVILINKVVNKKKKINTQASINADINLDGKIDDIDTYLLNLYVAKWKIELPYKKLKYGDANLDGKVTIDDVTHIQKYLNDIEKLSAEARINGDVNLDNKVDKLDTQLIQMYVANSLKELPYKKAKYGDVNLDGVVNKKDSLTFKNVINGKVKLSQEATINGDLNLDGVVNKKDYEIIKKYLAKTISKLPVL